MAFVTVTDRDFVGTGLSLHETDNWDECLLLCKEHPECQFVVHGHVNGNNDGPRQCFLKKDITVAEAHSEDGLFMFVQGFRVAVAVERLSAEQVEWQWARGPGSVAGTVLPVYISENKTVEAIEHNQDGKQNTYLCQLLCIQQNTCTHIVHNSEHCWLMNAKGTSPVTISQASDTIINLVTWAEFDRR